MIDDKIKIIDCNPNTNDEDEVDKMYEESAQMLNILRRGSTVIKIEGSDQDTYIMGRRGFRKFDNLKINGTKFNHNK